MKKLVSTGLVSVVSALVLGSAAFAAPQCGPHKQVIEMLSKRFSEVPKAVGIVGEKRIMEVFLSKKGTWTILVTNSEGLTCILAAGDDWEDVPDQFASVEPAA
jgi:hypothetical protein